MNVSFLIVKYLDFILNLKFQIINYACTPASVDSFVSTGVTVSA